MSGDEARLAVIAHWWEKADQALSAAIREYDAGDIDLAVNRVYYACFYASSAILLERGQAHTSHTGVRTAVHRDLVKSGMLSIELGKFYDQAFDDRQKADYTPITKFDALTSQIKIENAKQFVEELRRIASGNKKQSK